MSTVERRDSIESTAEGVWLLIDVKVKPDMIQATRQRLHAALTEIPCLRRLSERDTTCQPGRC
jgi:hypothetical protein